MDIEACACPCGCRNLITEPSLYTQTPYEISAGWYVAGPFCDACLSQNHQYQLPEMKNDDEDQISHKSEDETDDALTILKKRLAKGEITDEEFIRKKTLIESE